jgi:transposase
MKAFCKQLKNAPSFLFVGDSAIYEKCVLEAKNSVDTSAMHWLSRVPATLKEAKSLLKLSDKDITWTLLDKGYKISSFSSEYGEVAQRWLLVFSQQAYLREIATLERTVQKEYDEMHKKCTQMGRIVFNCISDAQREITLFGKKLAYHSLVASVEPMTGYATPGKPKNGSEPVIIGYKIQGKIIQNQEKITVSKFSKGRFILATNQLDEKLLPAADMLSEYKNQNKTEASFRFIRAVA